MKTLFIAAFATAFILAGPAWADDARTDAGTQDTKKPTELTSAQMDGVTASTGRNNVAVHVWPLLFSLDFTPTENPNANGIVIVPRK